MIDISEMKSLGSFDGAAAQAKEETDQGKPKPIHFRPTRHDQKLINKLKGTTGSVTNADVIRHALEVAVLHHDFIGAVMGYSDKLWHGDPEAKGTFEGIASIVKGDDNE